MMHLGIERVWIFFKHPDSDGTKMLFFGRAKE
jgi:hypothetical protein